MSKIKIILYSNKEIYLHIIQINVGSEESLRQVLQLVVAQIPTQRKITITVINELNQPQRQPGGQRSLVNASAQV